MRLWKSATCFFIPGEARDLSWVRAKEKKERFFASLRMTKQNTFRHPVLLLWFAYAGQVEVRPVSG
jgi:hypothetical protein